ncbi:MAG: hypothetical protein VKM17_01090 [Cyanobacteriota bacterium]|nr:hypothetical protein [Cyanobacteriota bacterium]
MGVLRQIQALLAAPAAWRKLPLLALVALGWLLSPLCWWNDLLINLPIAFGFAKVVSLFNPAWLFPGLVGGYWLSNVAGVLLMQNGALALLPQDRKPQRARELLWCVFTSSLYTVAIFLAVKLGWLSLPQFDALVKPSSIQGLAG